MLKLVKAAARTWTSFDKPKGAMRAEFNSEVAGATPLNDDSGNGWCCSLCASALEMESGQPSNRDANRHSTRSLGQFAKMIATVLEGMWLIFRSVVLSQHPALPRTANTWTRYAPFDLRIAEDVAQTSMFQHQCCDLS